MNLTMPVMDVARSAYVNLPPSVRHALGPLLGLLPLRFRFGKRYLTWRARIAEARRSPGTVRQRQLEALERVLHLAAERSPYYRETLSHLLATAGSVQPITETDAWQRIPVINNTVVRRENGRMCTRPTEELDHGSTGGSSGIPLSFYLDKDRSPVEYAFVMDAWAAVGYTQNDWLATFRGFTFPDPQRTCFEVESGLREVRFSVFHMTDELMPRYLKEIEERGIRFIKGYPSALATLASFAVREGYVNRNVTAVLPHSEFVHRLYRDLIHRAFPNARIRSFYGLSEKCAFAVEDLDEPGTYDFEPLYAFTELLDDDNQPITIPGKRGRIVATGLLFTGMPFIRYDTGDEAELVAPASEANGWRLRLARVTSRFTDDYVVTRSGGLYHIASLFMVDDELAAVTDLQFEQSELGVLHMRCVLKAGAAPSAADGFAQLVSESSGGDVDLRISVVDHIPLSPRGKRAVFLQHLDTEEFGGGVLRGWKEKEACKVGAMGSD